MAHYAVSMIDYPVVLANRQDHHVQYLMQVPSFYLLGSPVMSARRSPYFYDEHEE